MVYSLNTTPPTRPRSIQTTVIIYILPSTLSALLVPKLQARLLPQDSIHGAAIQAFARVLPRRHHVLPRNLQTRQTDILFVGDGKRVIGVLDGQGDPKPRTGVERWRVGTTCQSTAISTASLSTAVPYKPLRVTTCHSTECLTDQFLHRPGA